MLPKRKLNKSTLNPSVALIKSTPTPRPDTKSTAIAASPEILVLFLSFVIPNAPHTDTANAVQSGYTPASSPTEIPPNAMCATASPKREYRLKTKNTPINEQIIAIAIPASNPFCMKL
jgi:hypothetical protein